jgi:uncharacterized membrane protein (DUF2068 family)
MPDVDDEDNDDDYRSGPTTAIRQRVGAPAILLFISGLLSLLISVTMLAVAVTKPMIVADSYTNYIESMPNGIMKEDLRKQFESTRDSMALNTPLNLSYYALSLLAGLIMVYGAWQMKTVGSYRWAVVAALLAFLPLSGCSIFSFPFGLYAVIRLGASDVVKGFYAARKVRHAN